MLVNNTFYLTIKRKREKFFKNCRNENMSEICAVRNSSDFSIYMADEEVHGDSLA